MKMNSSMKFLCFIILSFLLVKNVYSEPRATEAALICSNRSAPQNDRQIFVPNFLSALDILTPQVSRQLYGTAVINGTVNTTVYAYGECMKDLSRNDCNLCFAQCKTQILRCLPFQRLIRGGRLFYDGCYLRYDDYMFFNESLTPVNRTVCAANDFNGNHSLFGRNVVDLMRNLSVEAVKNDGFFVGNLSRGNLTVFGLVQCWEFVRRNDCARCLLTSLANITSCFPKEEGRVLNSGCYLRYSNQRFYNNSDNDAAGSGNGRSNRLAVSLAVCSGIVAVLLFAATVLFFIRQKFEKQKREKRQLGSLLMIVNNSKLNFSYETLERATNYFHASNKLGQGGSGSVYKGILPDGSTVAIKRLMFNTRQWVDHFFNEVNLISNIHHKNLVKLLGCSITGPESLLVYEYVTNQSLHDHLFGKSKGNLLLSWEMRRNIVLGTAEGLAYLHEESQFRIIHRDIKLSNVLLNDDFSPKIADFGLARLFPEDKTHISTAIAGTLGYMAPEYVVRGKLTEKADVYSFGILVIEVLSGKRNNAFSQNSLSILETVWKLYGTGRICEAIDASLEGNFKEDEAARLLQIGLLCAQASAELRPTMSKVVKMLIDMDEIIPEPAQPPFLNTGSGEMISPFYEPRTYFSQGESNTQSSGNSMTQSWIEPR